MKTLTDKVVAITGAASGIGQALAMEFAEQGSNVALADVNEEGLAQTSARCTEVGVQATAHVVDVADRHAILEWADQVVKSHGSVHLLVNNAGVAMSGSAEAQSVTDFEWLMGINFWGVVHGTQAFLPHLRAAGEGHVVNISSVFGLVSIPSQSAYNAAKFGVRGYSDALRMELELEGAPVSVTTVHPGGIRTAIARNARVHERDEFESRFDSLARTSPEKAARQIVRAIQRNRRRALIGPDAMLFDLVSRLPASLAQRITMAAARRQLDSAPPRT